MNNCNCITCKKPNAELIFKNSHIENISPIDIPPKIFRYFSTQQNRENFLKGNIWFCGPSQNRFLNEPTDFFEYQNNTCTASWLHEYSLSFSSEILDPNQQNIVMHNPTEWVNKIIETNSLINTTHQITWCCIKKLKDIYEKNRRGLLFLKIIEIEKILQEKTISLDIVHFKIYKRLYRNEEKNISIPQFYNSPKEIENAIRGNTDYSTENEIRICINTSDYNGLNLLNLVQHLKLNLPFISEYCEKI